MNTQAQYKYADGSGNTYLLTIDTLEYKPVSPENSSTGMYSGGEPKKVSLTISEYNSISQLLEKAILKTHAHQQDRAKMTGLIVRTDSSQNISVVLKNGSAEKQSIEQKLQEILDRD